VEVCGACETVCSKVVSMKHAGVDLRVTCCSCWGGYACLAHVCKNGTRCSCDTCSGVATLVHCVRHVLLHACCRARWHQAVATLLYLAHCTAALLHVRCRPRGTRGRPHPNSSRPRRRQGPTPRISSSSSQHTRLSCRRQRAPSPPPAAAGLFHV
jgi:hypothetical protein